LFSFCQDQGPGCFLGPFQFLFPMLFGLDMRNPPPLWSGLSESFLGPSKVRFSTADGTLLPLSWAELNRGRPFRSLLAPLTRRVGENPHAQDSCPPLPFLVPVLGVAIPPHKRLVMNYRSFFYWIFMLFWFSRMDDRFPCLRDVDRFHLRFDFDLPRLSIFSFPIKPPLTSHVFPSSKDSPALFCLWPFLTPFPPFQKKTRGCS